MSPLDPRRLQAHLRDGMRRQAPATRMGPFTCYLHPDSDDASLNLAVPDEPTEGRRVPVMEQEASALGAVGDEDPALGLVMVKAHFAANRRTPRVEFIGDCHPELPALLAAHGFQDEGPTPLLACTRASWRQVDAPAGLRVEPILAATPWEQVKRYLEVQREAYKIEMDVPERGPRGFWQALQLGAGLLALLDDAPAGAGGITPADDGLADVRGLAVRPAFRGQGVGSFLLSALARVAHETGVEALLATPDSDQDAALAARAGFVRVATIASWRA